MRGYETLLIKDIIDVIWKRLRPTSFTFVENSVGLDSSMNSIDLLLGVGVDDVRFIGIWGMGGIGKTTIARVVRERISAEFEFSIFLENVSDNVQKGGLISQQREILSSISMKTIDIFDVHEGSTMIRRLLRHKKVLLILDDVTNSDHLDYLAGKQEWFGSGSRVLITTRNEHLLIEREVERRFQVKRLNHDDALKLFSWKAFGKDHPEKNYIDLSSCVVSYADGLPLALKVLGSFLRGRHVSAWNSALGKLRDLCNTVLGTLQISYDDLDDREKKIFLDIACFFNGEKEDRVIEILDSCGFCACIGIDVLIEKSLLTNSYGTLWMHQLLQEMGRELVNRECLDEPGNRSRLWRHEEGKHVLSKNTGTDAVESITMDKTGPVVHADAKCFSRMKKLRLLNLANVNLSNDLEYLSDNLRSLEWDGYPSKYFPLHFNPENLLELNMCHSHIESFWTGVKKEWFNPQSVEYPLSVELRPGWFTEKWMGFAVCLVFAIQERSPNCDPALDYPSFDYNYTHIITCKVDINGKEMTARRRPFAVLNAESGQAVSDHLWVIFFPRHFPQLWKGISDQIELPSGTEGWQGIFGQITFSITARVGHGVIVKQSAARLVYEGDLEELDPRFRRGTRSNVSISEVDSQTRRN
ncbi:hypothetical protein L3X38_037476 [Prunus dulcis]|uniref:ADP-ribosyl cyclase/cyclic ADP-ribose hydrolase n=1 Tax=Prunus dulcis TaxID=3755 RepID=A0AAD4YQQ4_PRUDU|nr:hypothetical protein L3X38_037476 [Prunus dulcis]